MSKNDNRELEAVKILYKALDKKFAQDLTILDLRGVTPIADFFVLATGGSAPQIAALAETAEETLIKEGMKLYHSEGVQTAKWLLLDFGGIVVHIFDNESRTYYNLERTWGDSKILKM